MAILVPLVSPLYSLSPAQLGVGQSLAVLDLAVSATLDNAVQQTVCHPHLGPFALFPSLTVSVALPHLSECPVMSVAMDIPCSLTTTVTSTPSTLLDRDQGS